MGRSAMMKWFSSGPTATVLLTLAACLFSASGCQKNTQGSAIVSGRVLYNKDIPVPFGAVLFHTDAGIVGRGIIQRNGTYHIDNLPEGEVKICVKARDRDFTMQKRAYKQGGEKGEKPTPTEASRRMDQLTAKYGHVETTPLTFTIQGGEQKYDIVLSLP
jgi:hypothetical protein